MNVFPELIPAFENREQLIPLYEEYDKGREVLIDIKDKVM